MNVFSHLLISLVFHLLLNDHVKNLLSIFFYWVFFFLINLKEFFMLVINI